MAADRSETWLKKRSTGEEVDAVFIDGLAISEVIRAQVRWTLEIERQSQHHLRMKNPRAARPEHWHWDWTQKYQDPRHSTLAFRWMGIATIERTEEGEEEVLQGIMLLNLTEHRCRIQAQRGKELVYVHYLATAPWNSRDSFEEPVYSLVGKQFIAAAIALSDFEEWKGRIGLHSLRQAESYYSRVCTMTDLGNDESNQGLRYFEMTPDQADTFCRREFR